MWCWRHLCKNISLEMWIVKYASLFPVVTFPVSNMYLKECSLQSKFPQKKACTSMIMFSCLCIILHELEIFFWFCSGRRKTFFPFCSRPEWIVCCFQWAFQTYCTCYSTGWFYRESPCPGKPYILFWFFAVQVLPICNSALLPVQLSGKATQISTSCDRLAQYVKWDAHFWLMCPWVLLHSQLTIFLTHLTV